MLALSLRIVLFFLSLVCLVIFFFFWKLDMMYWVKELQWIGLCHMVVRCGERKLYRPVRGLSFLMSLCPCTVNFTSAPQCFPHLDGTGWLEGTGNGFFPLSRSLRLLLNTFSSGQVLLWNTEHSGVFQNDYFFFLSARSTRRLFSCLYSEN